MKRDSEKAIFQLLADRGIQIRVRIAGEEMLVAPDAPPAVCWADKKMREDDLFVLLEAAPVKLVAEAIPTCSMENRGALLAAVLDATGLTKDTVFNGEPLWKWSVRWMNPQALAVLLGKRVQCKFSSIGVPVRSGFFFKTTEIVEMQFPAFIEA